jgi:hypothetical protein
MLFRIKKNKLLLPSNQLFKLIFIMNFQAYQHHFESILDQSIQSPPYDSEEFYSYVKLNQTRQNRWLKKGVIESDIINSILSIDEPQEWVLITEPWCGDAAHSVPFIIKLASYNSLINVTIQLRDSDSEIDKYLTNGSKSIPKLVVRRQNVDLFHWGPRPEVAQILVTDLKNNNADLHHIKEALQKWYNEDQGKSIQQELLALLQGS